jgi:hypothetical protein
LRAAGSGQRFDFLAFFFFLGAFFAYFLAAFFDFFAGGFLPAFFFFFFGVTFFAYFLTFLATVFAAAVVALAALLTASVAVCSIDLSSSMSSPKVVEAATIADSQIVERDARAGKLERGVAVPAGGSARPAIPQVPAPSAGRKRRREPDIAILRNRHVNGAVTGSALGLITHAPPNNGGKRYFGCGTIRMYGFGDFQPCG